MNTFLESRDFLSVGRAGTSTASFRAGVLWRGATACSCDPRPRPLVRIQARTRAPCPVRIPWGPRRRSHRVTHWRSPFRRSPLLLWLWLLLLPVFWLLRQATRFGNRPRLGVVAEWSFLPTSPSPSPVLAPRLDGRAAMARTLAFVGAPITAGGPALGARCATRTVPATQLRRVLPACLRPRAGVAQRPMTAAPSGVWRRSAVPRASVAAGNGTVGVPPPPAEGDTPPPAGTSPVRLLALVRQVWRLARPFWGGSQRRVAWVWSAITVFLAFATTAYAVLLSFTQRMFWNALSSRDAVKFAKLLKF